MLAAFAGSAFARESGAVAKGHLTLGPLTEWQYFTLRSSESRSVCCEKRSCLPPEMENLQCLGPLRLAFIYL